MRSWLKQDWLRVMENGFLGLEEGVREVERERKRKLSIVETVDTSTYAH